MAGGYTHVTLAQLAVEEAVHRRPGLLHEEARQALQLWLKFAVIGSMGPDYPYLDIANRSSENWAAAMHRPSCLELIRECARRIRLLREARFRQKCSAWLFGFASHCVTDGTVHPVVNLKVGPYEQNKTEHRRCEMSQDVLVHAKLNLGPIALNNQLSLFVKECSDSSSPSRLDRDIAMLWTAALNTVHRPGQPTGYSLADRGRLAFERLLRWPGGEPENRLSPPDPHEWHQAMRKIMQLAENGGQLVPFARHAAAKAGLSYPEKPEPQYVSGLKVPLRSDRMSFEEIFAKTLGHVVEFWGHLSLFLQGHPSPLDSSMVGWSLDTGFAQGQNEQYVFWS